MYQYNFDLKNWICGFFLKNWTISGSHRIWYHKEGRVNQHLLNKMLFGRIFFLEIFCFKQKNFDSKLLEPKLTWNPTQHLANSKLAISQLLLTQLCTNFSFGDHLYEVTTVTITYGWFHLATAKICCSWWKLRFCNRCHLLPCETNFLKNFVLIIWVWKHSNLSINQIFLISKYHSENRV